MHTALALALSLAPVAGSPTSPAAAPPTSARTAVGTTAAAAAHEEDEGPASAVRVAAFLVDPELAVGEVHEIAVEVDLEGDASLSDSGVPAPLLQIDVPPSVELVGEVLDTYAELADNEFVAEPAERLLRELPARIPFRLVAEPGPQETIGLNVVGYVRGPEGEHAFLRRRLELVLEGGSAALEVPADRSTWSGGPELLHLGDRAADFTLPRADGTELTLSELTGEGWVIVTTYRAHW